MNLDASPTIPELARKWGKPFTTVKWQLLRMHEADMADAMAKREVFVPWLFRFPVKRWRVNLSRFYRLHPSAKDVTPIEEIDRKVTRLARQVEVVDSGHRALKAQVAGMNR